MHHPDTFDYTTQVYFDVSHTPGWTGTEAVRFILFDFVPTADTAYAYIIVLPSGVEVEKTSWGAIKSFYSRDPIK